LQHQKLSLADLKSALENLDYDFTDFSMDGFVAWLEAKNRCQIKLIPWLMPPAFTGVWIATTNRIDYIFYDKSAPSLLQQHIQLNLLARIILGHETLALDPQKDLANKSDLETVALRGILEEGDQQVLLDMIDYVIRHEGT
jgi:hypothetical protein